MRTVLRWKSLRCGALAVEIVERIVCRRMRSPSVAVVLHRQHQRVGDARLKCGAQPAGDAGRERGLSGADRRT